MCTVGLVSKYQKSSYLLSVALEWSLLHSGRTYRRRDGAKIKEDLEEITETLQEVVSSKSANNLEFNGLYKVCFVEFFEPE